MIVRPLEVENLAVAFLLVLRQMLCQFALMRSNDLREWWLSACRETWTEKVRSV